MPDMEVVVKTLAGEMRWRAGAARAVVVLSTTAKQVNGDKHGEVGKENEQQKHRLRVVGSSVSGAVNLLWVIVQTLKELSKVMNLVQTYSTTQHLGQLVSRIWSEFCVPLTLKPPASSGVDWKPLCEEKEAAAGDQVSHRNEKPKMCWSPSCISNFDFAVSNVLVILSFSQFVKLNAANWSPVPFHFFVTWGREGWI